MAQSEPTTALGWQDFFTTTLDGSITDTDTTISLASAPTPTEGFLVIEPDSTTNREIIMYTSVSGNDVVCGSVDDRGIGGTTARAHSSGVIVKMNTVSDMFEALQSGKGLADAAIVPAKWTNPYKFSVYRGAALTINTTATTVTFDTEEYDTNSNHSGGTYTAPVAGFYTFSTGVGIAATGSVTGLIIGVMVGGVEVKRLYRNGNVNATTMIGGGSVTLQLAANDTVTIYAQTTGANAAASVGQTLCWFTGHLVSRT